MQRFFVTFPLDIDMNIDDINIMHQLTRVLRIKIGEHIILFTGDGTETEYEIIFIGKQSIGLRGISKKTPHTEPYKKISLYQALPNKYEKIEYILQKGIEIGINRFIFFRSDRSQKLILGTKKIERFLNISREALEQCGGAIMPEILFLEKFPDIELKKAQKDKIICNMFLDTVGEKTRLSAFDNYQYLTIWVGPEGGWSDNERSNMLGNGFIFARFGNRVLRTETAGIVIGFGLMNV